MNQATDPRIRAAGPADLEAILGIEAEAFEAARRSTPRALRRALASGFQRVRVFTSAGQVAGFMILWPYPHTWRIYNLASDPRYRNQGVGGALLADACREAQRAGARQLVLESRNDPALLRFYSQRGFRVTGELPDYYAPGEGALRMALALAP